MKTGSMWTFWCFFCTGPNDFVLRLGGFNCKVSFSNISILKISLNPPIHRWITHLSPLTAQRHPGQKDGGSLSNAALAAKRSPREVGDAASTNFEVWLWNLRNVHHGHPLSRLGYTTWRTRNPKAQARSMLFGTAAPSKIEIGWNWAEYVVSFNGWQHNSKELQSENN